MTAVYVVTERDVDVALLKALLPEELLQDAVLYAAQGRYLAESAAGTLMSDRSRPVALILDAETEDPEGIREKTELITTMLYPASPGVPFKVLLAAPTLASLLKKIDPEREYTVETVEHLTREQIQILRQHSLFQELIHFLSEVHAKAA